MSAAAVSKSGLKPIKYPSHEVPRDPQAFFKKVYTHITDDRDLPKALALIKMGNTEIHKGLTDKNKTMMVEWVEKGSSADKQASRFVNLLKGYQKIFSGVDPDKFSQSSKGAGSAAAGASFDRAVENKKETKTDDAATKSKKAEPKKTSGPSLASSISKSPLERVKELGLLAGLTEAQVDGSLEEIVLPNRAAAWVIKTMHGETNWWDEANSEPYRIWENALMKLASQEEILLFCEGTIRMDSKENLLCRSLKLKGRGHFRGLETEESFVRCTLLTSYSSIISMRTPELYDANELQVQLKIIFGELFVRKCAQQALLEAAKTSQTAKTVRGCMGAFLRENNDLTIEHVPIFIRTLLFRENLDINNLVELLEALLPIVYKGSPPEVTDAIDKMILEGKLPNFIKASMEGKDPFAYSKIVVEKIRAPRDLGYAKMFLQELRTLPIDKPAFVMFGAKHAPGFKAAVLATKSPIKDDSKGDRKKQV